MALLIAASRPPVPQANLVDPSPRLGRICHWFCQFRCAVFYFLYQHIASKNIAFLFLTFLLPCCPVSAPDFSHFVSNLLSTPLIRSFPALREAYYDSTSSKTGTMTKATDYVSDNPSTSMDISHNSTKGHHRRTSSLWVPPSRSVCFPVCFDYRKRERRDKRLISDLYSRARRRYFWRRQKLALEYWSSCRLYDGFGDRDPLYRSTG